MSFDELNKKYARLFGKHGMYFECQEGWTSILDAYFAVVDHYVRRARDYDVRQVKEKYGGLRIIDSVTVRDKAVIAAINEARELAEARSFYVCERCGAPGLLRGRGWYYTACDEHATRDGVIEPPTDPPVRVQIGSAEGRVWEAYDPDLDVFVPYDPDADDQQEG